MVTMLKLPESLKTVSTTFTLLMDDSRAILSVVTVEPVFATSLVFLVILLTTAGLFSCRLKHKSTHRPSESLQVLSSVLTPTCTSRPRDYAALLDHSTFTKSKTIRFSLSKLFTGICMGDIEIRDFCDLPFLLNGPLRTYGWDVYLGVGFACRSAVLRWVVMSQGAVSKHGPSFLGEHRTRIAKQPVERLLEDPNVDFYTTLLLNASRATNRSTMSLDFVPYVELESAIRTMQHRLRPGHTASFEFTTIAPKIPFLSDQYIFCSYPFMPRRFIPTPHTSCRTSTPLLVSLKRIIEMLTLGTSRTTIETVLNVTAEHANALQRLEQELTTNSILRSAIVRKWGLKGWREHRFMLAWEAALLQAGCLAKWSITIQK